MASAVQALPDVISEQEYKELYINGFGRWPHKAAAELRRRGYRVEHGLVECVFLLTWGSPGRGRWVELSDSKLQKECCATRQGIHKAMIRPLEYGWLERRQSARDGRMWEYAVHPRNWGNGPLIPMRKCRKRAKPVAVAAVIDEAPVEVLKIGPEMATVVAWPEQSMQTGVADSCNPSLQNQQLECSFRHECLYCSKKLEELKKKEEKDGLSTAGEPESFDRGGPDGVDIRSRNSGPEVDRGGSNRSGDDHNGLFPGKCAAENEGQEQGDNDKAQLFPVSGCDSDGIDDTGYDRSDYRESHQADAESGSYEACSRSAEQGPESSGSRSDSGKPPQDARPTRKPSVKNCATATSALPILAQNAANLSKRTECEEWPESKGRMLEKWKERLKQAFDRASREYPGQAYPGDWVRFNEQIRSERDLELFWAVLEAHRKTRGFRTGYIPHFQQYLARGMWRTMPKPDEVKSQRGAWFEEELRKAREEEGGSE
jgi:hypothetical protein